MHELRREHVQRCGGYLLHSVCYRNFQRRRSHYVRYCPDDSSADDSSPDSYWMLLRLRIHPK